MKTQINATIVADSLNSQGDRLTSLLITFPRIILAEVNTHRMLSKNTSSSRAIPFNKMVEAVKNDPFIPIAWQKHHSGMQGTEYITEQSIVDFKKGVWLMARNKAIQSAEELYYPVRKAKSIYDIEELKGTGVTKQLCNRLLEPFMWTTMLVTGSKEGWDNFFRLRLPIYQFSEFGTIFKSKKEVLQFGDYTHIKNSEIITRKNMTEVEWLQYNKGQAEIHIMTLAESIYDAMNESTPKQLQSGEWHIPNLGHKWEIHKLKSLLRSGKYDDNDEITPDINEVKLKISTSHCARISYTTLGDNPRIDYEADIKLHDRLLESKHLSCFEHCSKAMTHDEYYSFRKGFIDMDSIEVIDEDSLDNGWCNNFRGFINYRYLLENKLL